MEGNVLMKSGHPEGKITRYKVNLVPSPGEMLAQLGGDDPAATDFRVTDDADLQDPPPPEPSMPLIPPIRSDTTT